MGSSDDDITSFHEFGCWNDKRVKLEGGPGGEGNGVLPSRSNGEGGGCLKKFKKMF